MERWWCVGWVGNSLHSKKIGFFALFFQWFQITVGVRMKNLSLILSNVFNWPALNNNPVLKFVGVLVIFGIITALQLGGTKYTATIARWGFVIGILLMSVIFFGLAIAY